MNKLASFRLLGALLLILSVACGDPIEPDGDPPSIAGRYVLQTIDGSPLPFLAARVSISSYNHFTGRTELSFSSIYEITAGHWQLNPGGTCSSSINSRYIVLLPPDPEVLQYTSVIGCSWTVTNGSILVRHYGSGGSYGAIPDTASITGEVLTTTTLRVKDRFTGPRTNVYGDVARWHKAASSR